MQKVFVLHTRPYRETSLLIEVLSESFGRLGLLARGVRSAKSSKKGMLQPFMPLIMEWKGKGDLPTVTQVENDGCPVFLTGNLLISGFYINEIIMRLVHRHEAVESIFHLYGKTLRDLSAIELSALPRTLRHFEKHLLDELGYGLSLQHDIKTHRLIERDKRYYYFHERGFIEEAACTESSLNHSLSFTGQDLLAIAADDYSSPSTLAAAKILLKQALHPLLGDKPLQSRELWR
ncbi:MAG: DNA repair protein RecO [Pseudomonadota bacterium]|nr:DNA repair protein RecO [Gammaproteobacteria bacterium]MBU1559006.1 DNA repair protein RecO [Gammaproteobacteria bacterium]MBU1926631.1 DNA repair protein RecO [Gammaproteobacteria bacterium]MBU2545799.1 DNA repair protein RecO [Gammaproteobacteria bacterium]